MKNSIELSTLLTQETAKDRLAVFAIIGLGLVESLKRRTLAAGMAVRVFFHASNCLYVKNNLRSAAANRFMSHGVQLEDLFDILPKKEAAAEFQKELEQMHSICLRILDSKRAAA